MTVQVDAWIPTSIALLGLVATVSSVVLAFIVYRYGQRRNAVDDLERRLNELEANMEEKVALSIERRINPVVLGLKAIETKLDNGLLSATKEHGQKITALQVEMASAAAQLAHITILLQTLTKEGKT